MTIVNAIPTLNEMTPRSGSETPRDARSSDDAAQTAHDAGAIGIETRTAYHEAGHAVLCAALHETPEHVSIREDGETFGRCALREPARAAAIVQVHLAGYAAEHVLTGRRSRQLDQEIGFALMSATYPGLVEAYAGVDRRDGHRAVHEVLRTAIFEDDDDVRREVNRYYDIARSSLAAVWPSVKAVADALLATGELERGEIEAAMDGADVASPVLAVQRANGMDREATAPPPRP